MKTDISDLIKMENGKVNVIHALQSNWLGTQWVANGSTYDGISWLEANETSKPTKAEIDAEVIRLQAEYDALEYQRDRAVSFPTWQEQLDMQYHDQLNGTTTWKDALAKVKADNPKE